MNFKLLSSRLLTAVVLALITGTSLSGCQGQQGGKAKPAASAATTTAPADTEEPPSAKLKLKGYETSGVFDARLEAAMKDMVSRAMSACFLDKVPVQDMSAVEDCIAEKIAMAADPAGDARRHCSKMGALDKQIDCALTGTIVKRLRARNSVAMSESAWSQAQESLAQELMALGMDQSFSCARVADMKDPAFRSCLGEGLIAAMDGNPADGEKCYTFKTDEDFGKCIGEAGMMKMLEETAARTGV